MPGRHRLTVDALRAKLDGTTPPAEPTEVVMPPGSERWPRRMRAELSASLRPAAVLIPVIEHASELTLLLTQRAADLKHHASQISFPGGGMEAHDADLEATALRETQEEVGIAPEAISVVGYLEPMPTTTGFAVTPVVGVLAPPQGLILDPTEVELAFEVPVEFVLDERNAIPCVRRYRGVDLAIVEFRYEGHRIWGATAHMLLTLRNRLL